MRRNGIPALIFIVVMTIAGLTATFASGNKPLLGLDLQGGVSVVLQPVGETDEASLDQAIEIIRQRIDGIGVAEPEISRQGGAIVVQVPGVKDRDRILELVGQTAELRFRPVLQTIPAELLNLDPADLTSTTDAGGSTTAPTTAADATTTTTLDAGEDEQGYGLTEGESAAPLQTPPTTAAPTTSPDPATTPPTSTPTDISDLLGGFALTDPADDAADAPVTLGEYDSDGNETTRYQLGPTVATGDILSGADARINPANGTWEVGVDIRGGDLDAFNAIAAQCFGQQPTCPTAQLAIVLDSRVRSAPVIQAASFDSDGISISGSFTERDAKDLALVLRYGSLPVVLEAQQTQSVSATLGKDALNAGIISGLIGLALVAVYMCIYYRLLGLVAILSLTVASGLLWILIAYLGSSQGLALTLAGVTGIIVSIGVAVDSNVVFYEHVKEDVAKGRTLRSAIDGSFASAFSTIVKADVASLLGAAILYFLTVGPVRGFAFYLGLSTLLDLIASYFFMRPLSLLLVKSKRLQDKPRWFGMPSAPEGVQS